MSQRTARTTESAWNRTSVLLFILALLLRVLYTLRRDVAVPIPPGTDSVSYDAFARAILAGPGWILHPGPELFRPPGYPMLLSLLYAVTGGHLAVVQCLQSIAGALTVVLTWEFGRRHFGRGAALAAAVWLLVNPLHLDFSGKILRDTWEVLLNVAVIASLLAEDGLKPRGVWRTALLFTLLLHFDSRYLFHLPFFGVYFALAAGAGRPTAGHRRRDLFGTVRPLLHFFAAVVLLSAPWALRNALAYDHAVLIDPRVLGRWGQRATAAVSGESDSPDALLARWRALKQARFDSLTAEERAALTAGLHPRHGQPAKAIFNFLEFWRIVHVKAEYRPLPDGRFASPWSRGHNVASLLFMGLLLPAFLAAVVRAVAGGDRAALVLVAFIVVHTALHVVVHSVVRYRLPIEPFYGLLAFQEMGRWIAARRVPKLRAAGPAVVT